jgi:hypothetical protein
MSSHTPASSAQTITTSAVAPRQRKDPRLPAGLREREGYFSYTSPVDGVEYGLGRDRRQAIQQALEANAHLAGKRHTLLERITGTAITWDAWCDEFEKILSERPSKANTQRTRKSQLKRLRSIFAGNRSVSDITTRECSEPIEALRKAGKHRSAQAFRSFLIDCFDRLIARGHRKDNPARVLDPVAVKVQRARLTLEALMALYKATEIQWLRNAVALALVSGQDRDSVRNAKFADFRDGGWWNERAKTGARVFLPLSVRLDCFGMSIEDVLRQCRTTGVLSTHLVHQTQRGKGARLGKPMHIDQLTRVFSAELAKLSIDWGDKHPPTFHEIRSLSARLHKTQGNVNPQELLSHKDPRTTAIYTDGRGEWIKVSVKP